MKRFFQIFVGFAVCGHFVINTYRGDNTAAAIYLFTLIWFGCKIEGK